MKMDVESFRSHVDNYDGYCEVCDEVTRDGDTEPDAYAYECPECEGNTCMGIENAMMVGLIEIEGE